LVVEAYGVEKQVHSDAQATSILLAAARARMAGGAEFTITGILTETGISRPQFRRCFTGKTQLLAALTRDDVKALGDILEVAQPMEIARAVGSDISPAAPQTSAPSTDAWLERRLRVFERALAGLEKRQEKSEQTQSQRFAVMEETLAGLSAVPAADRPFFNPSESNFLPAEKINSALADMTQAVLARAEKIAAAYPVDEHAHEPVSEPTNEDVGEPAREPVSEKEMANFIAHARQAARSALPPLPEPRRRRSRVRHGLVLTSILIGGLILIGATLLLASGVPQASPVASTSHRQVAPSGFARLIALADSGDARAQTVLALAYLRGDGVPASRQAAQRWSSAAAAQGQPVAQYLLGSIDLESSQGEAARWLSAAAGQGNVKAMHNLAIVYAQGLGVTPDAALAVEWFRRAAVLGYRDSQFDLAVLYERGAGVPQNGAEALKWYLIAAAGGDAPSASRAVILKEQLGADDVRMGTTEAAGFVPQQAVRAANAAPEL
jgi:AcrR family transcriptional regulator